MNDVGIHIYAAVSQRGCASRKINNKQRQIVYKSAHKCPFLLYEFIHVGNYGAANMGVS